MSIRLIYETHSISEDNERGIATGWLPGALSARGRELAGELGRRRPPSEYAAIYVSDLRRAVETAEIAFGNSNIEINLDPRLRECNYGDLNGMPVVKLDTIRSWHVEVPYPNGESYRQVVIRVSAFLDDVRGLRGGQPVLVIGHAATRWALQHLLEGTPLESLVTAPFNWRPGWEFAIGG
ncbi:MAG TPA: histidine phosphatase family protein [Chloroflexota bacterium]|nr:histidine phosphatase family protein [Chloroflexota bacterium]